MGSRARNQQKRRASTYNALVMTGAMSAPEAELLVDALYGKPAVQKLLPRSNERNSKAAKAKRAKRKRRKTQ